MAEHPAATASPPLRFWHPCHHCDGRGCEVCEEAKGWWSVDAMDYDALRDALIFWVERARRFEEKLDQFAYMKARGVFRPEFTLGNRIFEESLPTVDEVEGILRDA